MEELKKSEREIIGGRPQLVISSRLLRAIQTAELLFPGAKIHTRCGMEELAMGAGNKFSSRARQAKFLRNPANVIYQSSNESSFIGEDGDEKGMKKFDKYCSGKTAKSMDVFFKTKNSSMLKYLIADEIYRRNWPTDKTFNVAIVGHSVWMRKFFGAPDRFHNNLETVTINFRIQILFEEDVIDKRRRPHMVEAIFNRVGKHKVYFDGVKQMKPSYANCNNKI